MAENRRIGSRGNRHPSKDKSKHVISSDCNGLPLVGRFRVTKSARSIAPPKATPTEHTPRKPVQALRKKKRTRTEEDNFQPRKRLQTAQPLEGELSEERKKNIQHWIDKERWPESLKEERMEHLYARRVPSIRRRRLDAESSTSAPNSDQEEVATPYKHASYEKILSTSGGSYMKEHQLGITAGSESLIQKLLETQRPHPDGTIFSDETFRRACERLQGKNEPRIFRDLTPILVPSAETLATLGNKDLDIVTESINESWNNCFPITKPRPKPDYAAGLAESAFSEEHLRKLQPFTGSPSDSSYFMSTFYMLFPFLTCEVKCGSTGLDVADRQNAHSMTVAVRGIVTLFQAVHREQELHREILSYAVSHDHESIRIWGHYPFIEGDKVTFWRRSIRKFDFTERDGKEKWASFTFITNLYIIWLPLHVKRIRSALDDLPSVLDSEEPNAAAPNSTRLSFLPNNQNVEARQGQEGPEGPVPKQQVTPERSQTSSTSQKRKKPNLVVE